MEISTAHLRINSNGFSKENQPQQTTSLESTGKEKPARVTAAGERLSISGEGLRKVTTDAESSNQVDDPIKTLRQKIRELQQAINETQRELTKANQSNANPSETDLVKALEQKLTALQAELATALSSLQTVMQEG